MTNYLRKDSSESLNNDMNLSEYSYQELGQIQKARAIVEVDQMVLNMLELSNRGLWSEYWITRDLIE